MPLGTRIIKNLKSKKMGVCEECGKKRMIEPCWRSRGGVSIICGKCKKKIKRDDQ